MRLSMVCLSVAAAVTYAPLTAGQHPPPSSLPPPARVGFQLGLRTGLAVPLGYSSKGEEMSNVFAPQVPIIVEIGGKVLPQLFVGGYLALGFGGAAGEAKESCGGSTCIGIGTRFGAEVQYHFLPDAQTNPWIGYGIGYESAGMVFAEGSRTGTVSYNGFEFGHFMGGVDFRLSRTFGLGPFAGLSIGQYRRITYENGVRNIASGDISETAIHEWFMLGLRTVFFP
jgi:hypothetical protein